MKRFYTGVLVSGLFVAVLAVPNFSGRAEAFSDGAGTAEDPYIVASCEDLQDVSAGLSAHYLQSGDIDCALTNPASGGFDTEGTWGEGFGFSPIGNNSTPFTGSYDGGGHAITNLFIDRPATDYVGLFGRVGSGEVRDVSVNSSEITGDEYVGAIVGSADGLDTDNQALLIDINTSETSVTGNEDVGGLAGQTLYNTLVDYADANDVAVTGTTDTGGAIGSSYASAVTRSASSGTVTGTSTGTRIGGFVGSASCTSHFTSSASAANVTATDNGFVGGFVGAATINCEGESSTFEAVTASGMVVGHTAVGGLVGYVSHSNFTHARALGGANGNSAVGGFAGAVIGLTIDDVTYGVIDESYATGTVDGNADTGGFIGLVEGGKVTNSYTRSNVAGSAQPGGFIGEVSSESVERFFIVDSYAANTVMAGVYPQGFIGDDDAELAEITNSYWDKDYDRINTSYGGEPKSTAQMKSVPTFTTLLGEESWDFDGAWGMHAEINDGYPCLRYFSDEDNCVYTALSDDDDLNGDDIDDNYQDNLSGYTNSFTGKKVVADVGEDCEITYDDTVPETNFAVQDPEYVYQNGMFKWEADCGVMGATTTIKLYYYDISIENLVVRKYTETTQQYSTIEGATLTEETINGHTVVVATYDITDGGSLDDDGEENGSIVDPAGVGQLASTLVDDSDASSGSGALAETGQSQTVLANLAIMLSLIGLSCALLTQKKSTH